MSMTQMFLATADSGVNMDELFKVNLYTGTGSALTINNGIDLSGDGGLVWISDRSSMTSLTTVLTDTERGTNSQVEATTSQFSSNTNKLTAFNSNGFTIGTHADLNTSADTYAAWTFKKAEDFFDIVTYTGNGASSRNISHNLGSAPGMMLVKNYGLNRSWAVYHKGIGATGYLSLQNDNEALTSSTRWNNTEPTSTQFTVSTANSVNQSGEDFVAYLFADTAGMIKCGSWTGDGTGAGRDIDCGFSNGSRFVLFKQIDGNGPLGWYAFDSERGITTNNDPMFLWGGSLNGELPASDIIRPLSSGFTMYNDNFNVSGEKYVFMAIAQ